MSRRALVTPGQYENMLAAQGGVCKICERPPKPEQRLVVDHDHETDVVRGLLCVTCNAGIGSLYQNVDWTRRAIEYLVANGARPSASSGYASTRALIRREAEELHLYFSPPRLVDPAAPQAYTFACIPDPTFFLPS